jgi:glucoamylase
MPQNTFINGVPYWTGIQLDEVAMPVLLAWRLRRAGALRQFDPRPLALRAARYLIVHGPVTVQERWEENSGYSPSTLASVIAALVIAAEFSRDAKDAATASMLLDHADWLSSHIEEWMATTCGDLVEGKRRHYLRITPADPGNPIAAPDPDHAEIHIANGGGRHLARRIVGGDFLHLVRLGVRAADDPLIVDSLAVIDEVIRRELPQGSGWRRYNFDGYGQKSDGSAFDGTGEGRCWPILTGERAHYELAAGRDVMPWIRTLENFANEGGMIPEQVWDDEDITDGHMKRGAPTGAAMPLCWSHAEYISLVRSRRDGVCFDRIEPVYQRYARGRKDSATEIWTFAHQLQHIAKGKTLRLIVEADTTVSWSADGWATTHQLEATHIPALNLWYADLPLAESAIEFTFFWKQAKRWEGRNFMCHIIP